MVEIFLVGVILITMFGHYVLPSQIWILKVVAMFFVLCVVIWLFKSKP